MKKVKLLKAFSLVELMISLITISCIAAAFTPVITKKLKKQDIALSLAQTSEIISPCPNNEYYTDKCKLCTKKYCIQCSLEICEEGQYIDTYYCGCKSCSDKYGEYCSECNKDECTKCKAGKNQYILADDKKSCVQCPASRPYSDGISECGAECNAPVGYFCDGETVRACGDKYQYVCTSCTSERCTGCRFGYWLDGSYTCQPCRAGCSHCTNPNTCTSCGQNWLLDTSGLCLNAMSSFVPYCINASGNTTNSGTTLMSNAKCTECDSGYYVNPNNNRECLSCSTIENCVNCYNNGKCQTCKAGYYANSNGKCIACSIPNCSQCNSNGKCGSCNKGYHLSDDSGSSCVADDGKFNCSDSNFMQIGKLCVTRKNMGDVSVLSIPSTVIKVDVDNEICYSLTDKCCWTGNTSGACNSQYYTSYSGCNRMVCNWEAANEICKKFNYGGKTWRLPTYEELNTWAEYSIGLSENGLMLCDSSSGRLSNQCSYRSGCEVNSEHSCHPYIIWGTDSSGKGHYSIRVEGGKWTKLSDYYYNMAFSTRCVTEME